MARDKILILSVDRDNDIGEKAGTKGPIIGKEAAIKAATALGIADPEDSDTNALFQAIRILDEIKGQYTSQIAVLTGDKEVGVKSDKIVSDQLAAVLKRFPATGAIFVSDGTEDESVIPIVQSRIPIISVKRVIVKQSEELETGYYKIKDFIKESLDNPKLSATVFGIPAIILILLAVFGIEGVRVVIGILGVYLLIKGFKLERFALGAAEEVSTALTRKRFVFFLYFMAGLFFVLGSYEGYLSTSSLAVAGLFEYIAVFASAVIFLYYISGAIALAGRSISHRKSKKKLVALEIFGFAISWVVFNAAELIISPEISALTFILSVVAGFAMIFVALLIEWKS